MDLTQLKMFCAVAESGSVVRAAEQLSRVPSNLTTRLRQLEEELGSDLFIREKQRLRLSPVGHNFLCYAQRILALSEEALAMTHSGEPAGNFALGVTEAIATSHLPGLLAAFHQRYPAVSLALTSATPAELIDRVRAGTLATALSDEPVSGDDLNSCIAFPGQLVLIGPAAGPAISHPADAPAATLYTLPSGAGWRARAENWYREAGVPLGPLPEVSSYPTLLACVAGGGGLALLPAAVLDALPGQQHVRRHPLPDAISDAATRLVWRRDAFTPNVKALKYLIIELFDDQPPA